MKYFIILFTTILIIFSQTDNSKKYSSKFFEYVEKINDVDYKRNQISFNDEKLDSMLYYYKYAMEFEWTAFHTILKELHEAWEKTGIRGVKPPEGIRPSFKIGKINRMIEDKYGRVYLNLIKTPYIARFKVLEISDSIYNGEGVSAKQVNLKVKIESVEKGSNILKSNNIYTVSYLPHWFHGEKLEFKEGLSYIAPLRPWYQVRNHSRNELRISDIFGIEGIKEIVGGSLDSPVYSELTGVVSWQQFQDEFGSFLTEKFGRGLK